MFDIKKYPQILKNQKVYTKKYNALSKAQNKFDIVLQKSGCYDCLYYVAETEKPLEERYSNCKDCVKSSAMLLEFKNHIKALEEFELFLGEEYAKSIFDVLVQIKPNLLERKTGNILSWEKVFPSNFSSLDFTQKKSLVALIEQAGGRYRIN